MGTTKNIAIISTNKNQYSETFIQNHVALLPGNIHFLFDGYLPKKYSIDKGVSEFSFESSFTLSKWDKFFNKSSFDFNTQLKKAIEKYLLANNIDAVLAEYGPCGVEMMSICKKLNIPLIVHFHGYDAYRNDILNSFENRYKELFDKASAVIGVSLDMCLQLMSLGCPQPKLHYLPYGIDTNIFKLDAKNKRSLTFVACGRFVEKKAPHLTIKAFSIVLKEVPEAKMIMIGEGELLNDCKKLSKELNIQNAIRFTGILSQDEIADIYNNSLAFVQHSIKTDQNDSEGTPLVILESGAAGLPVVSTLHAGIIDVVEEGETGFLVKEKDVEGMANRMLFLAKNRLVAMEMGQKAIQKIKTNYNIEAYTQRLWELMSNNIG